MKKISLKDFTRGWFVGNFTPSLLKQEGIEVAIQSYLSGDEEAKHYHNKATEISFIVSGSASFNGQILNEGDGIIIFPKEINKFKAISDCKVVVVKYPSCKKDKFILVE